MVPLAENQRQRAGLRSARRVLHFNLTTLVFAALPARNNPHKKNTEHEPWNTEQRMTNSAPFPNRGIVRRALQADGLTGLPRPWSAELVAFHTRERRSGASHGQPPRDSAEGTPLPFPWLWWGATSLAPAAMRARSSLRQSTCTARQNRAPCLRTQSRAAPRDTTALRGMGPPS